MPTISVKSMDPIGPVINGPKEEINALEAEINKLRDALHKIARIREDRDKHTFYGHAVTDSSLTLMAVRIAKHALGTD